MSSKKCDVINVTFSDSISQDILSQISNVIQSYVALHYKCINLQTEFKMCIEIIEKFLVDIITHFNLYRLPD